VSVAQPTAPTNPESNGKAIGVHVAPPSVDVAAQPESVFAIELNPTAMHAPEALHDTWFGFATEATGIDVHVAPPSVVCKRASP